VRGAGARGARPYAGHVKRFGEGLGGNLSNVGHFCCSARMPASIDISFNLDGVPERNAASVGPRNDPAVFEHARAGTRVARATVLVQHVPPPLPGFAPPHEALLVRDAASETREAEEVLGARIRARSLRFCTTCRVPVLSRSARAHLGTALPTRGDANLGMWIV